MFWRSNPRTGLTPKRQVLLILPFLAGAASLASAQSPGDRARLEALRDSLASIGETSPLGMTPDSTADANVGLIRDGLVLLRRGELEGDRAAFDQAVRRLEQALDRRGTWPYAWYGLGLVRLAMWNRHFVSKASPYLGQGTSYRRGALEAFARACQVDPEFAPAVEALAGQIIAMGHGLLDQDFSSPLRRIASAPGHPASASLALFRLEYGTGSYPAALDRLDDYLLRGGDSGVAALERARTLEALGRPAEAVEAYQDGLSRMGAAGRNEYRADLAWIASEPELAEFDSLPAARVAPWILAFWQERDAMALRQPGERVREHLRRWVFVHQNFLIHRPDDAPTHAEGQVPIDLENLFQDDDPDVARVMTNLSLGTGGFATYRRTQWEIDDRGVIYLRHGEPAAKSIDPSGPPNESWAYDLPVGRRVFHFLGSRALGTSAATTLNAALPPDVAMWDSRGNLDPRYTRMGSDLERRIAQARTERLSPGHETAAAQEQRRSPGTALRPETVYQDILRGRTAIAAGVTTDGFPQRFKHDLGAIIQTYEMGLAGTEPRRVLAVFAVPGRRLTPMPRTDGGAGNLYPVAIRVIALDRAQGVLRQLDTLRTFLVRGQLGPGQYLSGLVELPVPPGTYQIRVLITVPGLDAATGIAQDSLEIPHPSKDLQISDLVLGRRQSGLSWGYSGERISLNPLNAYPKGGDAELYYELDGLTVGESYEVKTSVRRADSRPGEKPEVQSGFEIVSAAKYQSVTRGVGLANLNPGAYLLEVKVEEARTGRTVTRQRALNILGQ